MKQEVNKIEFWKDRIKTAEKEHFSVYRINDAGWGRISKIHQKIIQNNVSGKVLDAGCGYGRASERIKDYTGVDFSPDFIQMAVEK